MKIYPAFEYGNSQRFPVPHGIKAAVALIANVKFFNNPDRFWVTEEAPEVSFEEALFHLMTTNPRRYYDGWAYEMKAESLAWDQAIERVKSRIEHELNEAQAEIGTSLRSDARNWSTIMIALKRFRENGKVLRSLTPEEVETAKAFLGKKGLNPTIVSKGTGNNFRRTQLHKTVYFSILSIDADRDAIFEDRTGWKE